MPIWYNSFNPTQFKLKEFKMSDIDDQIVKLENTLKKLEKLGDSESLSKAAEIRMRLISNFTMKKFDIGEELIDVLLTGYRA